MIKPDQIVIAAASMHPLLIKWLDDNAKLPIRRSDLAAGIDIMANQDIMIPPARRSPVKTGIALAAPPGTYARIAPRSGLAVKYGIDIGAGVIDEDYRGEIQGVLINNSTIPFQVRPGDRIAQLILEKILRAVPEETKDLSETIRGSQGFGSTGLEEILNARIISAVKAMKFHPEFCQRVHTKALQDDKYQLFLNTQQEDKDRVVIEGLIYFKGRLQIPDVEELRLEIAESEHDSKVAGHFGQKKTLELIMRNFYWPKIEEWVNEYVRTCDTCQRMKSPRHAKFGLLQPLELSYSP
jgi:dUTP pyrophosphatase